VADGDGAAAFLNRLAEQLGKLEALKNFSFYSREFGAWRQETGELLAEAYGRDSHSCQVFQAIMYTPLFLSCRGGDTAFAEAYEQGLAEAQTLLVSCLHRQRP